MSTYRCIVERKGSKLVVNEVLIFNFTDRDFPEIFHRGLVQRLPLLAVQVRLECIDVSEDNRHPEVPFRLADLAHRLRVTGYGLQYIKGRANDGIRL
eukprot:CAMPEP_0170170052 /NCGR_PEP_ID=MMETSP0040_2-20121228/3009_1 /TAXON_ID=641309 /ORGANISM="Lotharella oceanica, Strain CCMP622" /LENGTH=96 /DNA_ID=CAMNT_0010409185 /DNA_START=267 /DNA_END=557 /DNA_ORIENTATION=+